MILNRENIINKYPWINERNHQFIISSDYDGIICASLLNHFKGWELVGYYDMESIWISDSAKKNKNDIIWVDLNILPKQGRAIGGHIVSIKDEEIPGFDTSCNPNIIAGLSSSSFKKKFPMSTILFLLWVYNIHIPKKILSKMLVLHSDSAWLKSQHYTDNFNWWADNMKDFPWKWFFKNTDSKVFETRIGEILYPKLNSIHAISGYSKLRSKHLGFRSRELKVNPDWDEDIIYNLFNLFATSLHWTPPKLPDIKYRIDGFKNKIELKKVREYGLNNFLKKNKVFSYTITSPKILSYTSFGYTYKSPIK
tara:strand:- start:1091 stop:2017 length:927 start_codon:yes stop_codon:yes gene_type:complete